MEGRKTLGDCASDGIQSLIRVSTNGSGRKTFRPGLHASETTRGTEGLRPDLAECEAWTPELSPVCIRPPNTLRRHAAPHLWDCTRRAGHPFGRASNHEFDLYGDHRRLAQARTCTEGPRGSPCSGASEHEMGVGAARCLFDGRCSVQAGSLGEVGIRKCMSIPINLDPVHPPPHFPAPLPKPRHRPARNGGRLDGLPTYSPGTALIVRRRTRHPAGRVAGRRIIRTDAIDGASCSARTA